jgi:hypothetical protein
MQKVVLFGVLMLAASPALAAEFFVAQDATSKKCNEVETKPDGTHQIMIGTQSYATKDEAKAAKKAAPECKKPGN